MMDDKLALEILKILQQGQSFGYHTVLTDIMKMEEFIWVTQRKFKDVWDILSETKCIVDFRNPEQNYVRCWRLNPERDCITYYTSKIRAEEIKATPPIDPLAEERVNLEMQKLRGEVEDITNRVGDYLTTKRQAKWARILAWIAIGLAALDILLKLTSKKPG